MILKKLSENPFKTLMKLTLILESFYANLCHNL